MLTEEAVAAVGSIIEDDPNELIHHGAQQLKLRPSSLWMILWKNLWFTIRQDPDRARIDHVCVIWSENKPKT